MPRLHAAGIPTLILLAELDTAEKVAALDLGADDYLTKPFDGDELLERVWGPARLSDINYLRVAVRAVRRKIEIDPARPSLLLNEPGIGYRLAG